MAPLEVVERMSESREYGNTERDAFDELHQELEKGIQSMKNGDVYTIEEAWEEIDKV